MSMVIRTRYFRIGLRMLLQIRFRCYTEFCNPPKSVTQRDSVEHFLKHARVSSVDRHEVGHVREQIIGMGAFVL